MNLQETFYVVGIVYMTLYTILLIVVIALLIYIKKKVNEFTKNIQDALAHPQQTAAKIGSKITSTLINKANKNKH